MAAETQRQTIRAGLFFLIALIVFVGAALWVAGSDWVQGPSKSYTVKIAHSGTLAVGDSVVIAGVPVGDVVDMNLHADEPVPVTLRVDINPAIVLHTDSAARVVLLDLLGGTALEVDPGSRQAKPLKPGDEINGMASTGTQDLMTKADQLATRTIALMEQTQRILSSVSHQMPGAVNTLTRFASSAKFVASRLEKLTLAFERVFPRFVERTDRMSVQAVALLNQAKSASARLEALSINLNKALGEQGERLGSFLDQGQVAFHEARAAAAVVSANRPVIKRTLERLS
ncbi:MAG: MlaD family protein, partial [Pseudomonadota bacterium]|nr:MlaD family protein [Pseudomonadota bacterium]